MLFMDINCDTITLEILQFSYREYNSQGWFLFLLLFVFVCVPVKTSTTYTNNEINSITIVSNHTNIGLSSSVYVIFAR